MNISRSHITMLSVVSIFTGMIAPAFANHYMSLPFPLTNMQIVSYVMLVCLAVVFLLSSMGAWRLMQLCGIGILGSITYLFFMGWNGYISSIQGQQLPLFSWGWIFLGVGVFLLLIAMFISQKEYQKITIFDRIIGSMGAMTILFLTALIVVISMPRNVKKSTLTNLLGTGTINIHTGVTISSAYPNINHFSFDRKQNELNFFVTSGEGVIRMPNNQTLSHVPITVKNITNNQYTTDKNGFLYKNHESKPIGTAYLQQSMDHGILFQNTEKRLTIIDTNGIRSMSGSIDHANIDIVTSSDGKVYAWKSRKNDGEYIVINGTPIGEPQNEILRIALNHDGSAIMAAIKQKNGSIELMKNGIKTERIADGYISGSLRMNGNDSMYAVNNDDGSISLIYNGSKIDTRLEEVREIFLDNTPNYSFFGKPLGSNSYCFYTRHRGNLCGLMGYMNPQKSADKSAIIFAGLKNGQWGIYRNIRPIIANTGYTKTQNISKDYVFYDLTQPKYYVFISYEGDNYRFYKRGKWLPGSWKDVGLDVSFGYDGKIMTSAQDENGWRIVEI